MSILGKISRYWWCQLGGWGLLALSTLLSQVSFRQPVTGGFVGQLLIIMLAGIVSTHLLRWFMRRNHWLLLPVEKLYGRLLASVIVTSVLFSLIVMGLDQVTGVDTRPRQIYFLTLLLGKMLGFGVYIIPWVLIYYFYHYLVESRRRQLDTLKLEAMVKELELKTIKSHINPHFIFNALNSIRALIDEDPRRAREAVTHLGNILRSSMQTGKSETVPLEKELGIVRDYLALEHIRFEERLEVEYHIDQDTLLQPVPPMMLQTLVENAIKHGIGKRMSGGMVKVTSDFIDNFHELTVQNSGYLNGYENPDGFGLSGTRNRLHLLFGEKAIFDIAQKGELVEARVLIPKS